MSSGVGSTGKKVRRLTDGAMMTAIVGVFLLLNRYTGEFFESMLLFLFPIPMVFYAARYGARSSWPVLAAMVLLAVVLGSPATVFYVAAESLLGLYYGNGVYKQTPPGKLLRMTMIISVGITLFTTVLAAAVFGYDINAEIELYKSALDQTVSDAGMVYPAGFDLDSTLRTLFMVSLVASGLLDGYVTHALSRLLLKRFHYKVPEGTPLAEYFPPLWSGYVSIRLFALFYWSARHTFAQAYLQNICLAAGAVGTLYLLLYGAIAMLVVSRLVYHMKTVWAVLLDLLYIMLAPLLMVIIGFLYITTQWHARILERGRNNATKTE